jgi:hypothetical protein
MNTPVVRIRFIYDQTTAIAFRHETIEKLSISFTLKGDPASSELTN